MSREIKFRAWDKIDKIMREVTCYNLYDEYVRLDEDNSGNSITRKIDDVILMQYTGLKDKNGKEIYEGDIVDTLKGKKIVVYSAPSYYLANTLDDYIDVCEFSTPNIEEIVIGNIYDNPEILKELTK